MRGIELGAAWGRWESNRPPGYRMSFQVSCNLCYWATPGTEVEVHGAAPADAEAAGDPGELTVDVLFAALADSIGASRYQVAFDPRLGYPISIDIDLYGSTTEDDQWFFHLTEFTLLEG